MEKYYHKVSFIVFSSVFLLLIYHIALMTNENSKFDFLFVHLGRIGWIGSDLILCSAGFFCGMLFYSDRPSIKHWLHNIIKIFKWIIPSYYTLLLLYLTIGVMLQNYLGNTFALHNNYLPALLLFYVNFLLSNGPFTGVALEGAFLLSMALQLIIAAGLFLSTVKKKKIILIIIISLWVSALLLRLLLSKANLWFFYFNTFTRLDAFIGGLLLWYFYSDESTWKILVKNKNILLITGIVIISIAAVLTKGLSRWHYMIDIYSYPALSIFSFTLLNWIFSTKMPALINRISDYNKITFSVFVMKLPIIYCIKATYIRLNIYPTKINNLSFIILCILFSYLFGTIWFNVFDKNVKYYFNIRQYVLRLCKITD